MRAPIPPLPAEAVRASAVSISFPVAGGGVYEAVAPTSFGVADGEFVSIVGPTGCGKSTLLNVVAGLATPTGGTVSVFGAPLAGLNRQAGYLFQGDALMPWKSALDNVAIALEVNGVARADALRRAETWLAKVGLRRFAHRYPHQLSGGQRKRVGLAQVLIRGPKLLLMDEPFGPLDAQTRTTMGDLLLELWAGDRTGVVFVTHDLHEAIALSDRVLVMSAGPGARIILDQPIPLARPRDIAEIQAEPGYRDLHHAIWSVLRAEVARTYAEAG